MYETVYSTMDDLSYIHLDINLAYVAIFAILGLFICSVHVPKEYKHSGYRKARITLGTAFLFMAACCICRFLMPDHQNDYVNFWLLTTVSLLFSWLNYTAFLYLIDVEFTIRKNFFVDGIVPTLLMGAIGAAGLLFPQYQTLIEYALGAVFIVKCVRMFYICEREWRRVNREQQNYYDEEVDIAWMRILIWITLVLSVLTCTALYIPAVHFVYDYAAPLVYIYMTLKIVNYLPQKIDRMRAEDEAVEMKEEPVLSSSSASLKTDRLDNKVGIFLERWVKEKRYCVSGLSIKDVATQMGTNHNYLSKYLNECLGITFQMWLNTLRIEESKQILSTENISIEEVGIKVGIPESYNFSRWFKVITGTTPLRYRKEENLKRKQAKEA